MKLGNKTQDWQLKAAEAAQIRAWTDLVQDLCWKLLHNHGSWTKQKLHKHLVEELMLSLWGTKIIFNAEMASEHLQKIVCIWAGEWKVGIWKKMMVCYHSAIHCEIPSGIVDEISLPNTFLFWKPTYQSCMSKQWLFLSSWEKHSAEFFPSSLALSFNNVERRQKKNEKRNRKKRSSKQHCSEVLTKGRHYIKCQEEFRYKTRNWVYYFWFVKLFAFPLTNENREIKMGLRAARWTVPPAVM